MYSGRRRRSGVRDDAVRDSRVRDDIELLCGLARRGEGVLRRAAHPAGDDLDGERLARLGRVLLARLAGGANDAHIVDNGVGHYLDRVEVGAPARGDEGRDEVEARVAVAVGDLLVGPVVRERDGVRVAAADEEVLDADVRIA